VVAGLVSLQRAHDIYGVVLRDRVVDAEQTDLLRADLAQNRPPQTAYDYGPGRTEWERVHGLAAGLIAEWLPGMAAGVRRYAQAQVYRLLHETGPGPYDAPAVQATLAKVAAKLSHVRQEASS